MRLSKDICEERLKQLLRTFALFLRTSTLGPCVHVPRISAVGGSLIPIAALLVLATSGCSARHASSSAFYRLAQIDSQYFLIAPGTSPSDGLHQTIPISLTGNERNQNHPAEKACGIPGRWFSVRPAGKTKWVAETPTAESWARHRDSVDMRAEWDRFLGQLLALQQENCFPTESAFRSIKQQIVESMSTPADESLLYRYSYGPGGYVDLEPEMELRVERNFAPGPVGTQRNASREQSIFVTTYGIVHDGAGVRLRLIRIEGDKKKLSDANLPDTRLVAEFKQATHLRLLLQSLAVSANISSPAILLGASDRKGLDEATRAIVSNAAPCDSLRGPQVACVSFDGLVTVNAMLNVFANGHRTYTPLGSRWWSVVPVSGNSQSTTNGTVRIHRRFKDSYADVQFDGKEDAGQLLLEGGDEISW